MTPKVMENTISEKSVDFMDIEWQRGVTPDDIKTTCYQLCADYLGGVWSQQTADQLVMKRLSGGLTNQLYYCALNENERLSAGDVPQEVVIRLYEKKHFNTSMVESYERITDTIIGVLVSKNKLGPKIYGLFESGQILKYYKHKPFRTSEQNNVKLVVELAKILANIHSMKVPIRKTGFSLLDVFDGYYKEANELFDLKSLINECNCEILKKYDLKNELQWLKKTITAIDSPVMFSHMDFRGNNILVTESDGLVIIDYEYSAYSYRGIDFGTLFAEWGRVWGEADKLQDFPEDNVIKPFIDTYIEESIRLNGNEFRNDRRNTYKHILKETKLFSLVANMFFVTITLKATKSIIPSLPFNKTNQMLFTEAQYKNYYHLKQRFESENIF